MRKDKNTPAIIEVYTKKGCACREKSLLAFHKESKKILVVGNEAENYSNSEDVIVVNPFKEGIISSFTYGQKLLLSLIKKYETTSLFKKPKVIVKSSCDYSEIQRKAIEDIAYMIGCGKTTLIIDEMEENSCEVILEKYKGDILLNITIDEPYLYLREKAKELKEYGAKVSIDIERLIEILKEV